MERKALVVLFLCLFAPAFTFATYWPVKCIYRSDVSPIVIPANLNLEVRESCRNICIEQGKSQFIIEYSWTTNCLCGDFQDVAKQTCRADTIEVYQILDNNDNPIPPSSKVESGTKDESSPGVSEVPSEINTTETINTTLAVVGAGIASPQTTTASAIFAQASPQPIATSSSQTEFANSTDNASGNFTTLPIGVIVAIALACLVALSISIFGAVYFRKKNQVYPGKRYSFKNDCETSSFTPSHILKLAECASEPVSSLHRAASSLRTSKSDKTTKRLTGQTTYSLHSDTTTTTFPHGFLYRTNSQTSIQSAFFPIDSDECVPPVPQMPSNEALYNVAANSSYTVESYVEVTLEESSNSTQNLTPMYPAQLPSSRYGSSGNVSNSSVQAMYNHSQGSFNSSQSNGSGRC
ncbi:hypothetical protein HK098_002098 [Nowakowskiella sp. JEL0407]|nr:hypothetical protein HK098_002098 [Nowakowskiella sp. JEL0407]